MDRNEDPDFSAEASHHDSSSVKVGHCVNFYPGMKLRKSVNGSLVVLQQNMLKHVPLAGQETQVLNPAILLPAAAVT